MVEPLRLLLSGDSHLEGVDFTGTEPPSDYAAVHPQRLAALDADPNDLRAQRWGIVVPDTDEAAGWLDALQPLSALRADEQQAAVEIYRVPPLLSPREARRWRNSVYLDEEQIAAGDRPRYLLLLGGYQHVSEQLEAALGTVAFVGRLWVERDGHADRAGLHDYAAKVVRACSEVNNEPPTLVAHIARGASTEMLSAKAHVFDPLIRSLQHDGPGREMTVLRGVAGSDFRASLAAAGADLFVSVAKGHGPPPAGWTSREQQVQLQGAPFLDGSDVLSAASVGTTPMLRHGIWILHTCFGGSTRMHSSYSSWLDGHDGRLRAARGCLPVGGGQGFVSALAQRLLSAADGPLAFVAPADLAWANMFVYAKGSSDSLSQRLSHVVRSLLRGRRIGAAMTSILSAARNADDALLASYEAQQDALGEGIVSSVTSEQLVRLWLLRNELHAYSVLGDPAIRLRQEVPRTV